MDQLLLRVNFLAPDQMLALAYCLEDMTVQDLLGMSTAQALANVIEEKAAALDTAHSNGKEDPDRVVYILPLGSNISLSEIGDVAFQLLRYVHQMFDPLHIVLPNS